MTSLTAQEITVGVKSGISINRLNTNLVNKQLTVNKSAHGYFIGVPVNLKLSKVFSLSSGIYLIQKNYTVARTGYLDGIYQTNKNTYVQLPLLAGATWGKKAFKVTISAGAYYAYWATARVEGKALNIFDIYTQPDEQGQPASYFKKSFYNQRYIINNKVDRRYEYGWLTTLNAGYTLRPITVFAECSHQQALSDHQKTYMINQSAQYNKTLILTAGIKMPL